MNIYEIIFSPTGGTQKAADVLAAAFEKEVEMIDLADKSFDASNVHMTEEDVCIIAAPAYGGRVPQIAVDRLKQLKGNGAKAVLVAVYENISEEVVAGLAQRLEPLCAKRKKNSLYI